MNRVEQDLNLAPNVHQRVPAFVQPADLTKANIGSAISSIFTPPGTNQRNAQVNQQSGYSGSVYNNLWPGLSSQLQNQQNFYDAQLPNLQQGVQNAYFNTTQGGRNAMANNAYGQYQAMGNQQAAQANSKFAGNPSLAQGYGLAAMNNANTNASEFAGQLNSPQGQQAAWGNYNNALQNASTGGVNYSGLGAMNSAIYGQPQVPVGQGLGGVIGSLIPTVLGSLGGGAGLSALLGGGGGSSANSAGYTVPNDPTPLLTSGFYMGNNPYPDSTLAQNGGYS